MTLTNKKKFIFPVLGILFFYLLLFFSGIDTTCYLKGLTGIPCPGCGYTRSFFRLFRGDIKGAFYYHPLFILPFICVVLVYLQYIKKYKISKNVWLGIFLLVFGVYIIRMIMYFPHTSPLDFGTNAIFPKIWRFLQTKIHGL